MAEVPAALELRSLIRFNARALAAMFVWRGIYEEDDAGHSEVEVVDRNTLNALRLIFIDFLQQGCGKFTYPLSPDQAKGLPSFSLLENPKPRCFVTVSLGEDGQVSWRVTWTTGELSTEGETDLIHSPFGLGLQEGGAVHRLGVVAKARRR